jgi:hypothetical protein
METSTDLSVPAGFHESGLRGRGAAGRDSCWRSIEIAADFVVAAEWQKVFFFSATAISDAYHRRWRLSHLVSALLKCG